MLERPTEYRIQRAREAGMCPWCGESTQGLESAFCPACGHNITRPLGPVDPGSPGASRLGLFLALSLILVVALMQQLGTSVMSKTPVHTANTISQPSAQFEITAKVMVKIGEALKDPNVSKAANAADSGIRVIDDQAGTIEDQLRAAMVAGELVGGNEATSRLDRIEPKLPEDSPLHADIRTLRIIYSGETPVSTSSLITNHGWFGKLAASYGTPDSDPGRAALIGGGKSLVAIFGLGIFGVIAALIAGFVLLIIAIVKSAGGTLRTHFVPPSPGGSVAIETVVVFALGFIVLKLGTSAIEPLVGPERAVWITLGAQWLLLGVLLWPRVRGVRAREGVALLGWYRGRGVLREIGCGFVGYLACLPLLFAGAITSVILLLIYTAIRAAMGQPHEPPPDNKILELAGKASAFELAMIFLLASVWAPIVEESVFRGGLYRHLRSFWHWFPAAVLTGVCFGVMHGYPFLLLGPVIALGTGFSLMREWRGSLIAPVTAHCLHNATVLTLLLVVFRIIGS